MPVSGLLISWRKISPMSSGHSPKAGAGKQRRGFSGAQPALDEAGRQREVIALAGHEFDGAFGDQRRRFDLAFERRKQNDRRHRHELSQRCSERRSSAIASRRPEWQQARHAGTTGAIVRSWSDGGWPLSAEALDFASHALGNDRVGRADQGAAYVGQFGHASECIDSGQVSRLLFSGFRAPRLRLRSRASRARPVSIPPPETA